MYRRFRKSLIKLETNAHIPCVIGSILRHMRIDHESTCNLCDKNNTDYSPEELEMLDPSNNYYWDWCTCDLTNTRWASITREEYWHTFKLKAAKWVLNWVRLHTDIVRKDPNHNGMLYMVGIEGTEVNGVQQPYLKYERIGAKYYYYRARSLGWRN